MDTIKAPEQVRGPAITDDLPGQAVLADPTQVRRPWRATARTIFAALVALAALLPVLVQEAGLDPDAIPWLGTVLLAAGAVTRIMAHPLVERFLRTFLPWLAAAPKPPE